MMRIGTSILTHSDKKTSVFHMQDKYETHSSM